MSNPGTKPVTVVHKDFWQVLQNDFYAAEQWVVTEAQDGLAVAGTVLKGFWSIVAPRQLAIIGRVALTVETKIAAGDTFGDAMVAGLNELVVEEKAELSSLETSLLNVLVQLHLMQPKA